MPDEIPFGNFNSIFTRSHIFLNPQNHFPIIGLAGSVPLEHSVLLPSARGFLTVFAGMALSFDGLNDYLRIAHDELFFPSQVLFLAFVVFCFNLQVLKFVIRFVSSWVLQTMCSALPCG